MGDMKDKFKGFMKKVNNQLNTSSSGKFKGQGRVLGSSSSPSSSSSSGVNNPNVSRQYVNPHRNQNQNQNQISANSSSNANSNSKPISQKLPTSGPTVDNPSIEGQNASNLNPNTNLDPTQTRPSSDGFDPYGSLITSGKRNKNGFSLNVFECPVCNRGFGSEDEVSIHIETCIVEKNENVCDGEGVNLGLGSESGCEVEDESKNEVGSCVGVYISGNPPEGSIDVVLRLFGNIVKDPENQKFRRIRMSNPKIRETVGDVVGGVELLERVGFELKEEEGEMWAVMDTPSKEGIMVISETIQLLEQTKNIGKSSTPSLKVDDKVKEPEIIDRQIKVFFSVPESVAARIELPESFYKLSLEEVKREAEMKKKKMAESQLLIPKSLKEKQAQAARRRYTRTIVRVQFPDGVVLQGIFSPKEPTSALYAFVSSALKQQGLEFELIHPIPLKRRVIPCFPKAGERVSMLEDEDLVPSALVKFKPIETDDMVFTGLTNELLEISEPLGATTS
ncbi:hypothetical protein RND81_06G034600 [Saponaria officinalis]|uniref:UBX domain-containing protein n=1 Tax=Saponaria officinalis TaxID=3572 RepID=A0AAW1K3Q8_SAPOF